MAKNEEEIKGAKGEAHTCEGCHGNRFQVHERGIVVHKKDVLGSDVVSVEVNELAIQCLDCHRVATVPVKGVVDYYA